MDANARDTAIRMGGWMRYIGKALEDSF